MDRLVYVAMTGAKQSMKALTTVTHNLANVNTTGFRADLQAFGARPVEGPGFETRVNAVAESEGWDQRQGAVTQTGRKLDVAILGDGWLAVQRPDGGEGYTRAGDLRLSPTGMLETASGHLVLGESGPISLPPFEELFIGDDGGISVVPLGQTADSIVEVDRLKLVNPGPEALTKGRDGLFLARGGEALVPDGTVRVANGHLESSNVNAVASLVEMIELQRQYEMQLKSVKDAEENERAASGLLSVGR